MVYVGSLDSQGSSSGKLFALDAQTGAKLWSYATGGEIYSSPAVAKDVVYIAGGDGNVAALKASDGGVVWNYPTGNPILWSSPAIVDGVLFVGSDNGVLYAFGPHSQLVHTTPTPTRTNNQFIPANSASNNPKRHNNQPNIKWKHYGLTNIKLNNRNLSQHNSRIFHLNRRERHGWLLQHDASQKCPIKCN